MSWDEFCDLLSGLNDDTALVKLALIRTESDPEVLKNFSPAQRSIRAEWQRRRAKNRPKQDTDAFLEQVQETFSRMFKE